MIDLSGKYCPLLLDGGMGSTISTMGLFDFAGHPGCNEILNQTCPGLIAEVHRRFFLAGSNIVETNTFGGTPIKLAEWGLGDRAEELNRLAAKIARKAADEFSGMAAGSLGPSGLLPTQPGYNGPSPSEITRAFRIQARGLIDGGVDVLLVETSQDILEFKCAVIGCRDAIAEIAVSVPVWGSVSLHMNGRMLMGTSIDAALAVAVGMGLDAFGVNCATGPSEMIDAVKYLADNSPVPVIVFPNAGMPVERDGCSVWPQTPDEFGEQMSPVIRMGAEIIGGCCGTTPEHIAALKSRLHEFTERKRPERIFRLASAVSSQNIRAEGSPLVIGERLNSHGSKKFRRLLLAEDWKSIIDIARQQQDIGAQALDLSLAVSERENEPGDYEHLVKLLSSEVSLPLMIDSVNTDAVEAALINNPGIGIVNSINLENPARCERVINLLKRYGGAVVAMTIDESGMAKTVGKKLEIAEKLYDLIVTQNNLPPDSILFDPLTFTLATGEDKLKNAAKNTLEAIPRLREKFPQCGVVLGISNVSYGFPPDIRKLINAIFLHHAVKAGLTAAIVNPLDLTGIEVFSDEMLTLADDLIFNRSDDAIERLTAASGTSTVSDKSTVADISSPLPCPDALRSAIIDRRESRMEEIIDACLVKIPANEIVNAILLPAMREVGDRMNRRETILPHVLRSAEIMKRALNYLTPLLSSGDAGDRKKIVLATVFGDVHDIGKNLVKAILSNNGFDVIDLGKQVPARTIVEAVKREKPLAVGLSALLVSTSAEMGTTVKALHENDLHVPVIIGGAAVSPAHARKISSVNGDIYTGGVYYGSDAFEALDICRRLAGENPPEKIESEAVKTVQPHAVPEIFPVAREKTTMSNSMSKPAVPPFIGPKISFLNQNALVSGISQSDLANMHRAPSKTITEVQNFIKVGDLMKPVGLYGYFPCKKTGDAITVDHAGKTFSFTFPSGRRQSVINWFSDEDYLIPYVVTLGKPPVDIYENLESKNRFELATSWAQLCSILAEVAAEMMRNNIARELGLNPDLDPNVKVVGVSPGYALWPDISDQLKLCELLTWSKINLSLTPHYQIVPEFSTSGIAIIHPDACY